jgi:hypothetical protein
MTGMGRRVGAATAAGFAGIGFGIPCLVGILHFADTGEVWQFLGFPTYGEGPFVRIGIPTTVPLLAGFLAVCVAEVVLAVAIVRRSPWAAKASTILLPFELVYWTGFALPFGFVFGMARIVFLRQHPTLAGATGAAGPGREPGSASA